MSTSKQNNELKWPELLLFTSADIFGGGGQSILSVLYLVFLTNILSISPAWAGAVIMVAKAWDAVSDPLMGVISDNTRSRMGRRKPYLVLGGSLLVVSMGLLWLPVKFPSHALRVAYVTVTYLLYCTVSTIIAVPYSSMSTEITGDYSMRNRVNLTRLLFSLLATAVCTLVPTLLFDRLEKGSLPLQTFYFIIAFGFGAAFAIPNILAGLFVQERVPYDPEKTKFSFSTLWRPLKVGAFRKLLSLYLAQSITLDIVSAVIIYYGLYVVPGVSSTVFLGTFLGMQLVLFPVLMKLVDKIPKPTLYRFGLPLSLLGAVGIALFPGNGKPMVLYGIAALTALGFAGAQTMSWIMFPDVVDIGELTLKQRIAGSFSGAMTFVRKLSSAIAIFMVGGLLDMAGFIRPQPDMPPPAQPDSVLLVLRLIILLAFVLLMGAAWFIARGFPLDASLSKRVKQLLEKRHAGAMEQADHEEEQRILQQFG